MFPNYNDNNDQDGDLDDFRQKLSNNSIMDFEEKKNEINRSKNIFLGAVSGVAMAAVVGWLVLSPRYSEVNNSEIPLIRRPQTAVKVQPVEPGGMEILNQDKSVYDIVEKKKSNEVSVEKLLPPPEVPQIPTVIAQETTTVVADSASIAVIDKIIEKEAANSQNTDLKIEELAKVEKLAKTEAVVKVVVAPKVVKTIEPEAIVKVVSLAEVAKQAPSIIKPKRADVSIKIPAKSDVKIVAPSKNAGPWQVQLMSSANKSAIESSWSGLLRKYSVLQGETHEVEAADLGSKGVFYRLKAGGYSTKAQADKLCNDLKALGGSCFVKKK